MNLHKQLFYLTNIFLTNAKVDLFIFYEIKKMIKILKALIRSFPSFKSELGNLIELNWFEFDPNCESVSSTELFISLK